MNKKETLDKRTQTHLCDNQYCIQNGGDICDRIHCPIGHKQTFYDDITDEQEQLDFVQKHERIPVVIKAETHGDVIYRQDAIDAIEQAMINHDSAIMRVVDLPSAEPERKTGKWILVRGSNGKDYHKCSECLHTQDITGVKNYCAVCGARMEVEEDGNVNP